MNLLGRQTGWLLLLAIPFFLSCEDESSLLGFKSQEKKLQIRYAELSVPTTMTLVDSIPTENLFAGNEDRLLVGSVTTPQCGKVTVETYTQYAPSSSSDYVNTLGVLDSITLALQFDHYFYGSNVPTVQTIGVYELSNELDNTNALTDSIFYFNQTAAAHNPTLLATKIFLADGGVLVTNVDSTYTIHITLPLNFGQEIFDTAVAAGLTYTDFTLFKQKFKGLAIVPLNTDKVLGFSPTGSVMTFHYHAPGIDSLEIQFDLTGTSFNHFESDRSGSEIAAITTVGQVYAPINGLCYAQSGTSVQPIFDFSPLFQPSAFFDTIPANSVINAASLLFTPTPGSASMPLPTSFILRLLRPNNRPQRYSADLYDVISNYFRGTIINELGSIIVNENLPFNDYAIGADYYTYDPASAYPAQLTLNDDMSAYEGALSLFFQDMLNAPAEDRFFRFAATPVLPDQGKSVNQVSFPASSVKLKIYYTVPQVNAIK
jgi:Domain of unknown function (DUF4270)